jgi:hypothetical protein
MATVVDVGVEVHDLDADEVPNSVPNDDESISEYVPSGRTTQRTQPTVALAFIEDSYAHMLYEIVPEIVASAANGSVAWTTGLVPACAPTTPGAAGAL